ncbi:LRR_1 domain-containing protein/LRRNT_2 domain-containing protein [Cephalotus follicularis]|uniref:LRR_1 domain-containing protein/LRRNT_2 domain-containing protein n=1 Tax=Cephalotus follicularis TaxID=3775 RepID=A0A1Q3BDH8_CEPFO|nr:LRR_1 domain-containing protein/LRRNT_2 domain-containing protein [Cephalotus follicularis]
MRISPTNLCVFFASFWIHAVLLLLKLFSSFSSNVDVNRRNGTDQLALLQFKAKITRDPLGVLNSWNDTINLCQWHGVTCGRRHLRVTKLALGSLQLSGSISPQIGNLSFLTLLNLNGNSFSDEIPSEIGHLRRLETLYFANNSFSGEIPGNISSCTNLVNISISSSLLIGVDLSRNHLIGPLPTEVEKLTHLEGLYLYENMLSGVIPSRNLYMEGNFFHGPIPLCL